MAVKRLLHPIFILSSCLIISAVEALENRLFDTTRSASANSPG